MARVLMLIVLVNLVGIAAMRNRATADSPADLIFVASWGQAEVVVIDSTSDRIVGRIPLPGIPGQLLVLDRGSRLVASDPAHRKLHLVEVAANRIDRDLDLPIVPTLVQVNRANGLIAVGDPTAGMVMLVPISGEAPRSVSRITGLQYLTFDPQDRLLAAHGSRISAIDATGRTVAEMVADPADGPIVHVVTDPGGDYAFAAQADSGVLSVFDLHTAARVAALHLPRPLGRSIASPDSQTILVPAGGQTIVISTWTLKESLRIRTASSADTLGLALSQSVVAIASRQRRTLSLYDLRDRRRLGDLTLPGTPEFGTAAANGLKYYVPLADTGQVVVVDLTKPTGIRLIDDVGTGAWAVVSAVGDSYCH